MSVCLKNFLKKMSLAQYVRRSPLLTSTSLLTLMKIWKGSGKTTLIGETNNFDSTGDEVGNFGITDSQLKQHYP